MKHKFRKMNLDLILKRWLKEREYSNTYNFIKFHLLGEMNYTTLSITVEENYHLKKKAFQISF